MRATDHFPIVRSQKTYILIVDAAGEEECVQGSVYGGCVSKRCD